MNARTAAILCGLIALPGGVVPATGADKLESWRERSRDSQTWSERMSTEPSPNSCGSPRGPCRLVNVEVRNDRGDKPLHCGASVQFPQPNAHHMREWGWSRWIVVAPGQSAIVNTARVPTDLAVADIYSECRTSEPPPMSTAIQDVTAAPPTGKTIERNGARWTELYDAAGYPKTCGTPEYTDYCLPGKLRVRNETTAPIVCHGEIRMPEGNKLSLPSASRDMIVMPKSSVVLVKTMTAVNTHAQSHASDCRPWQSPPSPVSAAGCNYKVRDGVQIDYPPGAKEREEEGPVVLHFTLAAKSARPENIEVAGSSLFPELDAAAVSALATVDMTTECPGERFSVRLPFRLAWENEPPPPPPPPPRVAGPPTSATGEPCKVQVLRFVDPDDYYPRASLKNEEQGDVIVRVFAAGTAGAPLDAQIDTGSGFPALDAAGLLAIGDSRFSTNCAGYSQRFKVKFRLKEVAPESPAAH